MRLIKNAILKLIFCLFLAVINVSVFAAAAPSTKEKLDKFGQKTAEKVELKEERIRSAATNLVKSFEDISPEDEYYIGRAVAATILANYPTYKNDKLENYLNSICQTLAINSEIPDIYNGYHVKILDTTEINAFATSGGHIFITRGLIGCTDNEDSLASVIAHEMGHIQLKHGLKAIKNSRFMDATAETWNAVVLSAEKAEAKAIDGMVSDVMSQMANSGYSKKQEFEADSFAVNLLYDSGYDPSAILTMLDLIQKNQKGQETGMYKTHPSPKSRITNAKSNIGKTYAAVKTNKVRTARYQSIIK